MVYCISKCLIYFPPYIATILRQFRVVDCFIRVFQLYQYSTSDEGLYRTTPGPSDVILTPKNITLTISHSCSCNYTY